MLSTLHGLHTISGICMQAGIQTITPQIVNYYFFLGNAKANFRLVDKLATVLSLLLLLLLLLLLVN